MACVEACLAQVGPGEEGLERLALCAVFHDAHACFAGDFEQRAELRVGEKLPSWTDHGNDAPVQVEAVDKALDEAVKVGVCLAQDGEGVAEGLHAQRAGEDEARDAGCRVVGLDVCGEPGEAGDCAGLQLGGEVAEDGDGELVGHGGGGGDEVGACGELAGCEVVCGEGEDLVDEVGGVDGVADADVDELLKDAWLADGEVIDHDGLRVVEELEVLRAEDAG